MNAILYPFLRAFSFLGTVVGHIPVTSARCLKERETGKYRERKPSQGRVLMFNMWDETRTLALLSILNQVVALNPEARGHQESSVKHPPTRSDAHQAREMLWFETS